MPIGVSGVRRRWRPLLAAMALVILLAGLAGAAEPIGTRAPAAHPRRVVAVDPGHGGRDRGKVVQGVAEKTYTLDIAYHHLRRKLRHDPVQLVFTRTGDRDVDLSDRAAAANAAGADLFVSVHVNWWRDRSWHGVETYYKGGSEASAAVRERSRRLACLIHQRVLEQYREQGCRAGDRGVINRLLSRYDRRSYYRVLREAEMPAVLVEVGYLSNAGDRACLAVHDFRDALAGAIAQGIRDYLDGARPGRSCSLLTAFGL